MKKLLFLLRFFVFLITTNVYSQYDDFFGGKNGKDHICYYLLNTEIRSTMAENEMQKDMKDKQLANLTAETSNKWQWQHYREKMEKIQSRLNSAGFAIQALPSSFKITQEITKIYDTQEKIYEELEDAPLYILTSVTNQIEFIDRLQMTIKLMAGLIISYGTINQMEIAERKILLDFVYLEFKGIRTQSFQTLQTIRRAKQYQKRRKNTLKNWVLKDKKIIDDIIKNANNL